MKPTVTKRVLVTGGTRGLGRAMVVELTTLGYEVIAPLRSELELSDPRSVKKFTENWPQQIHILVNNAGVNILNPIEKVELSDLDQMWQVNLRSAYVLSQAFARDRIKNQSPGKIVNITSVLSVLGRSQRSVYTTMKSGLDGLTRALAVELGPRQILVNSVAPGYVNTELTRQNNSLDVLAQIAEQVPLRRLAEPIEIARLVGFLVSDQNTYVTGQTMLIDGGLSIS